MSGAGDVGITTSDWVKGISLSVLASVIGGASKLAIRKSWLLQEQLLLLRWNEDDEGGGGNGGDNARDGGGRGEVRATDSSSGDLHDDRQALRGSGSGESSSRLYHSYEQVAAHNPQSPTPTTTTPPLQLSRRSSSGNASSNRSISPSFANLRRRASRSPSSTPPVSSSNLNVSEVEAAAAAAAAAITPGSLTLDGIIADRPAEHSGGDDDGNNSNDREEQGAAEFGGYYEDEHNAFAVAAAAAASAVLPLSASSPDNGNKRNRRRRLRLLLVPYSLRLAGMIGMTFLNPLCSVLAMNYASPSILAPFSGLTLVWIVLLSSPLIGESPTKQQVAAASLIVAGEVMVAVWGDHTNDEGVTAEDVVRKIVGFEGCWGRTMRQFLAQI